MPRALLLSPDDQAVSAITGVLEEMSVSCERPLDGVSAAQKLNSHNFDLVLVDCENLPAAKLIFDVCRRGKGGNTPVPIAIVDGRAGLPTAFRLGAELILTKPVAKDQARSTIRTAVGRLRKEEPARAAQAAKVAPTMEATPTHPEERAQALAAAVSSQPARILDGPAAGGAEAVPVVAMSAAAVEVAPAETPPLHPPVSSTKPPAAEGLVAASKPTSPAKVSDDPVLADLEKGDVEPSKAALFSHGAAQPKSRGSLVALLILVLAGGGFYAGWMYQPGFRAIVQPQIDRVLALAGIAPRQKAVPIRQTPAPSRAQTSATPIKGTGVASPTASPTDAAQATGGSVAAGSPDAGRGLPAPAEATTKPELPRDAKKDEAAAASSDSGLPGEQGAVILSSKGAEKRLVRQVPPTFPKGATAQGVEGTVVLKTVVDDSGKVESVHLVEGNPALAEAAIRAVKQWRYRPYVRDGKSLPFQTVVLVDFQRP